MKEKTKTDWNSIWENHYDNYVVPRFAFYVHFILNKYGGLSNFKKIVEIGSGSCRDTNQLNVWGYEAIGLDISETAINKAKSRYSLFSDRLLVSDGFQTNFEDNEFDVLVHNGLWVNFTLGDIEAMLSEHLRITKKMFILALHNPYNLELANKFQKKSKQDDLYDIYFHSEEDIRGLLKKKCQNVDTYKMGYLSDLDSDINAFFSNSEEKQAKLELLSSKYFELNQENSVSKCEKLLYVCTGFEEDSRSIQEPRRNVICSAGINAYSIYLSLRDLDITPIVLGDSNLNLFPKSKESIKHGDRLFITEENTLAKYQNNENVSFSPKHCNFPLDNKYQLYKILEENKFDVIPYCEIDNNNNIDYPIVIKCKHSWYDGKKNPRGYVCKNETDYQRALEKITVPKLFFVQKLLAKNYLNYSVCGYFDFENHHRNLMVVTKKILGYGDQYLCCGAVVATMKDPANLIDNSCKILNKFRYVGPFELEYIHNQDSNHYCVNDFNPRFWMQNGIFFDSCNNGLIKRYLGLDKQSDWVNNSTEALKVLWVFNITFKDEIEKQKKLIVEDYKQNGYTIVLYPKDGQKEQVINSDRIGQFYQNNKSSNIELVNTLSDKIIKTANQFQRQGKLAEALKLYYQIVEKNPKFYWVYVKIGETLVAQNKLDEAIKKLRQAIEINPSSATASYNLGLALAKQNSYDAAKSCFRQAIKKCKANVPKKFYTNLWEVLAKQGKRKKTISSVQENNQWRVGVAKVAITPKEPIWIAGYGFRNKPSEGVVHDLWAKAIVILPSDNLPIILVTLDICGLDRHISNQISNVLEKQHGLERDRIVLSFSHTHTGPVVGNCLEVIYSLDREQSQKVAEYTNFLCITIVEVVQQAFENMKPASITWGIGRANFAVNRSENIEKEVVLKRERLNLNGPVDHDVPVLLVRDLQEELIAIIYGYACHCTVLNFYKLSGDYAGFANIALEKHYPGAVAMFVAGCGADQNPIPRGDVSLAQQYGEELAQAVSATIGGGMESLNPQLISAYYEVDLHFSQLPTFEQIKKDAESTNIYVARRAKKLLEQIKNQGSLTKTYPYPIQLWQLGGKLNWIFMAGEAVIGYALGLKLNLGSSHTWVASYCNDLCSYIPTKGVLAKRGYEGDRSMIYYGLPTTWDENCLEEDIINAIYGMVKTLQQTN